MNFLEIAFTGRTMLILGVLTSLALIVVVIWLANKYNKKKKS